MPSVEQAIEEYALFRRRLEQLIWDGRYQPGCTPPEWWDLQADYERWVQSQYGERDTRDEASANEPGC